MKLAQTPRHTLTAVLLAFPWVASGASALPEHQVDPANVIVVMALVGLVALAGTNFKLRKRLRRETHQRITAETALVRHRNEVKQRSDERNHALHQLSFYDPLTDLPNRSMLYERLAHASHMLRREDKAFALLLIDLNRFKAINDTLGHYVGDSVLREVAIRLQKIVGPDMVYYLGGDEFAIMQPVDQEHLSPVAISDQIHETLAKPFLAKGLPINVGASIGCAYYPEHTVDADNLLRYAEIAMYSAKRHQQDWATYDPTQRKDTKSNLILAGELRNAFDLDELFLQFQPKVNLSTRRVVGFESLVRWHHPREGLMSPEQFVQLAEQTGLVRPLTLCVLNAAMAQCAAWKEVGIELPIAVNLSVLNLQDPHFEVQVAELLEAWDLPGHLLEIEITESAAIDDPERARRVLGGLSGLGMSIAVDDFGTGYSSFSYLKRLPINTVKIDKSFVQGMAEDDDNLVIVRAMIELAHNLGLNVVAEGVEDQATWKQLEALGCDVVQGFYVSPPLDSVHIGDWLVKRGEITANNHPDAYSAWTEITQHPNAVSRATAG